MVEEHENRCKAHEPLPADELIYELSDLYKMFSDSTRVKILYALVGEELCVLHLAERVDANQSAVSHQLRVLKQARLVKSRRDGKLVFYSLADDHITQILELGMAHVQE